MYSSQSGRFELDREFDFGNAAMFLMEFFVWMDKRPAQRARRS